MTCDTTLVQCDMSFRRIWSLKLILLLFWFNSGPIYPKMSGAKFSDPLTPSKGGPFRYRGPSDPLELNPCLAPETVDGF